MMDGDARVYKEHQTCAERDNAPCCDSVWNALLEWTLATCPARGKFPSAGPFSVPWDLLLLCMTALLGKIAVLPDITPSVGPAHWFTWAAKTGKRSRLLSHCKWLLWGFIVLWYKAVLSYLASLFKHDVELLGCGDFIDFSWSWRRKF